MKALFVLQKRTLSCKVKREKKQAKKDPGTGFLFDFLLERVTTGNFFLGENEISAGIQARVQNLPAHV